MRIRSPSDSPAWTPRFEPPEPLVAPDWRLSPLRPELCALDYAAFDGCRERLRHELTWNGWPPDGFSLLDNEKDLAEHYDEFLRREAYAYSVLTPDMSACIGCIYVEPWSTGAQLHMWLTDRALDLETSVLEHCLTWLTDPETWPFEAVIVPVRPHHARLLAIVEGLGLRPCPGPDGFSSFR